MKTWGFVLGLCLWLLQQRPLIVFVIIFSLAWDRQTWFRLLQGGVKLNTGNSSIDSRVPGGVSTNTCHFLLLTQLFVVLSGVVHRLIVVFASRHCSQVDVLAQGAQNHPCPESQELSIRASSYDRLAHDTVGFVLRQRTGHESPFSTWESSQRHGQTTGENPTTVFPVSTLHPNISHKAVFVADRLPF